MTTERINAWVSLMVQDPQDSGLFITTSRAVIEHLIEIVPEAEKIIYFEAIPMGVDANEALVNWQDNLMKTLEKLATENWPVSMEDMSNPPEVPGKETYVSLTIYIVPNTTPHDYFADFVETDVFQALSAKTDTRFKNTLIGLIEKNG